MHENKRIQQSEKGLANTLRVEPSLTARMIALIPASGFQEGLNVSLPFKLSYTTACIHGHVYSCKDMLTCTGARRDRGPINHVCDGDHHKCMYSVYAPVTRLENYGMQTERKQAMATELARFSRIRL
jgi:hypothetical protein